MPEPRDPVSPGDLIAEKYLVEGTLGRGGMGVVVKARHVELDQPVAIKVLREGVLDGDESTQRFMREARALARLGGEHVVRVSDVGRLPNGTPYMVMEYLDGTDLSALLKKRGPLPPQEVADYGIQVCAALADAHGQGLIHRDLKPGNLFLVNRNDGVTQLKVLDFGIAKFLTGSSRLTGDKMVLGSPRYMSPEQLRSPRDVDARADIWALGAIFYRLLANAPPFEATELDELLKAMLAGARRPLSEHRDDLSEGWIDIVDRCLEPDRAKRFATVAELARELAEHGPPGSKERAARIARVSAPPPAESTGPSSTVPFKAVAPAPATLARPTLEPTVDDPISASAPAVPSSAPPADMSGTGGASSSAPPPAAPTSQTPPPASVPPSVERAPRAPWKYVLAGAAVTLLLIGAVVASGVLGVTTAIVVPREVLSAPLTGVALDRLDPIDALPAAKKLARSIKPNAQLATIEVEEPIRGGVLDATRGSKLFYELEYSDADGTEGLIIVHVQAGKLVATRNAIPPMGEPLPDPSCGTQRAWAAAVGSGVPADARARFHYGQRRGASTWMIEVPGRPEHKREVDGMTCAVLAP